MKETKKQKAIGKGSYDGGNGPVIKKTLTDIVHLPIQLRQWYLSERLDHVFIYRVGGQLSLQNFNLR